MKHTKYWPYLKWSVRIFWGGFILGVIIVNLTGCSKPIECKNITINHTNIEYVYNTTIKEVFVDNCSETIYTSSSNNSCDISLIKQIHRLESIINKWVIADINITINETNTTKINDTNSS